MAPSRRDYISQQIQFDDQQIANNTNEVFHPLFFFIQVALFFFKKYIFMCKCFLFLYNIVIVFVRCCFLKRHNPLALKSSLILCNINHGECSFNDKLFPLYYFNKIKTIRSMLNNYSSILLHKFRML